MIDDLAAEIAKMDALDPDQARILLRAAKRLGWVAGKLGNNYTTWEPGDAAANDPGTYPFYTIWASGLVVTFSPDGPSQIVSLDTWDHAGNLLERMGLSIADVVQHYTARLLTDRSESNKS